MLGFSTTIPVPDTWASVEVADDVAVIRGEDGSVLDVQHVQWERKADLPYEWDEPRRVELTNAMANVLDTARVNRDQIKAMRAACDIVLQEGAV